MKAVKNYVYTERAHLMCPNLHFGIMAQIKKKYDIEQVRQSADILQKAHPFLQSLLAEEADTGRLYYQMQDNLSIPVTEKADVNLWQQGISVNDCLIAQMMLEENTDKVVIAADIRSRNW